MLVQAYFTVTPSYSPCFIASDNEQHDCSLRNFHLCLHLLTICEAELTAVFTAAARQCI